MARVALPVGGSVGGAAARSTQQQQHAAAAAARNTQHAARSTQHAAEALGGGIGVGAYRCLRGRVAQWATGGI
eukprot:COSAG02_NODE_11244_length_1762_cov_1.544197_1_plen_73_part_00